MLVICEHSGGQGRSLVPPERRGACRRDSPHQRGQVRQEAIRSRYAEGAYQITEVQLGEQAKSPIFVEMGLCVCSWVQKSNGEPAGHSRARIGSRGGDRMRAASRTRTRRLLVHSAAKSGKDAAKSSVHHH